MDVAYLCDRRACAKCNDLDDEHVYCTHTLDIKHAINFDELDPDHYMEIKEPTVFDLAISPEEFKKYMNDICETTKGIIREEDVHVLMDNLMCATLKELGYGEGVDIFMNTLKWYA